MAKKMLIDASHTEETRIAIMDGNRLEEFDFESSTKKQLKGNVYLAKVVRIEPSLQAAFVEFGGNRHGFLPFSEIHPDYYRIPIEDRETLLKEQAEANKKRQGMDDAPVDEDKEIEVPDEVPDETGDGDDGDGFTSESGIIDFSPDEEPSPQKENFSTPATEPETDPQPFVPLHRRYKIQEVLVRRQIMLVQVNKEERGGKGAALTTYLSIAGRYGVLMPNSPNSGGISRKITNVGDRKRLRFVISEIDLPDSMSLIIRTAGMSRTKPEIKRDCDYLVHLWNDIRELTLSSEAPCLIYEEGDLVKRSIRDYYDKDIDEVLVEGEKAFEDAQVFMKGLMPSHLRRVKEYKGQGQSLFQKYGVEDQISSIHSPTIRLKSGGYIVFGTTEALVAIDVNSGKATKERHIDETALNTNLEAADEVAHQLRLRDLAGLVVIDFIDMEDPKHNEAVERRLREAMRHDRARVQIGRISNFGLLELSRQRLRPNIIEATSVACRHCQGTGMMRSDSSSALQVIRAIEEELSSQRATEVNVYMPVEVALYILNEKRRVLEEIQSKSETKLNIQTDPNLIVPEYRIEREGARKGGGQRRQATQDKQEQAAGPREPKGDSSRRSRRGPYGKGRPQGKRESKQDHVAEELLANARPSNQDEAGASKPAAAGSPEEGGAAEPKKRGGRRRSQRRRQGRGGGDRQESQKGQSSQQSSEQTSEGGGKGKPKSSNPKPAEGSKPKTQASPEEGSKKKDAPKSWIKRLLE